VFLITVLGAAPAFLWVIEGVAESSASLLKLFSGIASDCGKTGTVKGVAAGSHNFSRHCCAPESGSSDY
jgi:hypothetical protein